MADAALAQPRIVPGAPPPAPLSKSQKKKRKSVQLKPKMADAPSAESILAIPTTKAAALVEKAPEEEDVRKGAVAEELVAQPEHVQDLVQETKPTWRSPAVDLLHKRIKVQTKKLSRIAVYSSKPSSELNEDQRKSVASLPSIQGAVRELEETKKAVEALEAEQAKELSKQRLEEAQAIKDKIAQAVSDAAVSHQQRVSQILSLLRLSSLLSSADPTTFTLVINDKERQSVYAAASTLLGSESPRKEEVVSDLLLGNGDIDGVTYSRLFELVESHQNLPAEHELTPTPEEPEPLPDSQPTLEDHDAIAEPPTTAGGEGPGSMVPAAPSSSFHFMQESELEGSSFEHGAEWIEKPDEVEVVDPVAEVPASLSVIDTGIPLGVNGLNKHIEEAPLSAVSAALDWAADDADGLPSIGSLHAKFGTSGQATPEAMPQDAVPVATQPAEPEWGSAQTESWGALADTTPNGTATPTADPWDAAAASAPNTTQVDEDGFVKARGGRGKYNDSFRGGERGRGGRGGHRGDRGGYRGRGSGDSFGTGWRGGDGEYRGRGGFRGDRGRGGEFRGGEHRGRGGRGGEFRGRGRGERGGFRGGRGGSEGNTDQSERPA